MIFTVYQQQLPVKGRGDNWDASLIPVGTVEAKTTAEAIRIAKTWDAFRHTQFLAAFPVVHAPYMDVMVQEERTREAKARSYGRK